MVPVGVRCSNEGVTDHNALAEVERELSDVARDVRYPCFGAHDRAQGVFFAKMLGVALEVAGERADEQQRLANLHEALRTRELIGQAQGILIERERITADETFNVLRRTSQMLNIKVSDVARTLLETGESPAAVPPVATHAAPPGSTPV